jgi:DNA-3-methyladenine glycosylase
MKLQPSFYLRKSITEIARDLLGKILVTKIDNETTSGVISETEAYEGAIDKASHAYNNRRTQRTSIMFREGGIAYVYLCYGIHHLFNVVSNKAQTPHAILIRSIIPLAGILVMEKRRKMKLKSKGFADGPGKLCQALGINLLHNGASLNGEDIWIEENQNSESFEILSTPRIGVDYAGDHALWPYRFIIDPNHVSRY